MDQIALGKRIKAAREKACMTQEELAAAVDYSVDHMSVVERGVKAHWRSWSPSPMHSILEQMNSFKMT